MQQSHGLFAIAKLLVRFCDYKTVTSGRHLAKNIATFYYRYKYRKDICSVLAIITRRILQSVMKCSLLLATQHKKALRCRVKAVVEHESFSLADT